MYLDYFIGWLFILRIDDNIKWVLVLNGISEFEIWFNVLGYYFL